MAKDDYLLKKTERRNACVFCVCCAAAAELFIINFRNQLGVTSFYEITASATEVVIVISKVKLLNYDMNVTKIMF